MRASAGWAANIEARPVSPLNRPQLTVIIATRNRAASLERTLASLQQAAHSLADRVEFILVDNGSTDRTPSVLARWRERDPDHRLLLHVPEPGKARALNAAWPAARAATLAFTDDDVEVPPNWLRVASTFADTWPQFAAATGPVRLPPSQRTASIVSLVEFYRTLPLFDVGSDPKPTKHLYGCNMLVRKHALEAVGGFDARLGPGASGLHEDGDLALRLQSAGLAILYWPALEMFHVAEPERLTWGYFRQLHRADARSRWVRDGNRGLAYALQHWLGALAVWGLWTLLGHRNRRMRARGRLVSHSEYLRLVWWARRGHSPASE